MHGSASRDVRRSGSCFASISFKFESADTGTASAGAACTFAGACDVADVACAACAVSPARPVRPVSVSPSSLFTSIAWPRPRHSSPPCSWAASLDRVDFLDHVPDGLCPHDMVRVLRWAATS